MHKTIDDSIEKAICTEIAKRSPFSVDQVYFAYKAYKSFDALIKAVDFCATIGISQIIIFPKEN